MKWLLRFVIGFSYLSLLVTMALLIRPEHASESLAFALKTWPLVLFVILVSSTIVGDTFIGMVNELKEHYRKESF
jgi:hypothetical protein